MPQDDATHILALSGNMTLCGRAIQNVWNAVRLTDSKPDSGGGCWTCLEKAEAIDKGLKLWLDRH